MAKSLQMVDQYTDFYHFDVMDGHYVRNFLFGPDMIRAVRDRTDRPFEIHLMVEKPNLFLSMFHEAGGNIFIVHPDTCPDLLETIGVIKRFGAKAGVALKPDDSISRATSVLEQLDMVLILGVKPGFKNQSFLDFVLPKISKLKRIAMKRQPNLLIEVDGGIRWNTVAKVGKAGADIVVAGSIVYKAENIKESFQKLRELRAP